MNTRTALVVALLAVGLPGCSGWSRGCRCPAIRAERLAPRPPSPAAQATSLEWDVLGAYAYRPGLAGLPPAIRALDGKRVAMVGYMLPLYEFDDIHEFQLRAWHGDGVFGETEKLPLVRIASARGIENTASRLRVTGTFRAKEVFEKEDLLAIYEIDDATIEVIGPSAR